jgi:putative endonuclease
MPRSYFTYITTNPDRTVLYTGMTNDLEQRIIEHYLNKGNTKTFAGRYYCYNLLFFQSFHKPMEAITYEKEIKSMSRKQKEELINSTNPQWIFLNPQIMQWPPNPIEITTR